MFLSSPVVTAGTTPADNEERLDMIESEDEGNLGEGQDSQPDEKGKGEGWVPKVRLDEVIGEVHGLKGELQKEREERIRLEERLKTPKTEQKYTRSQLLEAVAAGQVTQAQADEVWEKQLKQDIRKELSQELQEVTSTSERTRVVSGELSRYKTLLPDVMKPGETRDKVAEEFNYLVSLGAPATKETELAALRSAFGPIDALERKRSARNGHEPDPETGGGGQRQSKGNTAFDKLPDRYKSHYRKLIGNGMYSGEDDPKLLKEVGRLKPEVFQARAKKYG